MSNILSFEEFYNSIWLKVPSVWRDADDDNGKALQLVVYTVSQHMYYYFYNKMAYMDELFDPDLCPTPYLKFLASVVGWTLIGNDEKSWREQIKAAPLLYKIKGTKRGIALAEQLVGYSIFISDLYRDHLGELVPKEQIFNNTPDGITKPWFRTILRDDSGNVIPGSIESDMFDSYNEGDAFLDSNGNVVRPFINTENNTLVTRTLSTTPGYDNITGAGSLARYAKTPRINVVLKKIEDLDTTNSSGNISSSNIDEALDLLLKFKPFHVYINDIKVLVDVSDSMLGYIGNKSGGTGENPDDTINFRESFDFAVYINTDTDVNETISYRAAAILSDTPTYWSPTASQPTITAKIKQFNLSNVTPLPDFQYISSLGFSTKQFVQSGQNKYGYAVFSGKFITTNTYIDNQTLLNLSVTPSFSFKSLDISNVFLGSSIYYPKPIFISKHNLFSGPTPAITNVTLTGIGQADSISILYGSTTETQTISSGNPWNLKNLESFNTLTGLTITPLQYMQTIFNDNFVVALEYQSQVVLLNKQQYRIVNNVIILDTVDITNSLFPTGSQISDTYLNSSILYVMYLEQSKEYDDFPLEITSRGMYLHSRINDKFNRHYSSLDTNFITTENIKSNEQYTFNSTTGNLDLDPINTKLYRTDIPAYTRGTLRKALASGTTPVIIKNNLNPCDYHQWKVYSQTYTSYYSGSEQVSYVWWSDFYNVDAGLVANNYLVNYTDIDTSYNTQTINRESSRWQTALMGLDTKNPDHFLATRRTSADRNAIWTRSSALKMALPFKGDNRGNYQCKRGNTVLFNRTENLSDYATSITTPSSVSNYKYTFIGLDIDITKSYFNPVSEFSNTLVPVTNDYIPTKVKIHPTIPSYFITTTNETSLYDGSMSFTDRLSYYSNTVTGSLHTSPYSCNIVSRNYPQLTGLMYDTLDPLEINVDGLTFRVDNFEVIRNIDNQIQTSFILTYLGLFVTWYEPNTGEYVNFGNFALTTTATPNIKVFVNGIQMLYGTDWTLSLDTIKSVNLLFNVQPTDTVRVEYYTLSSTVKNIAPPYNQTSNIINILVDQPMISSIITGNLVNIQLPSTNLMVSWYDRITGEYLSTNTDLTDIMPSVNYLTAIPDVSISMNGIMLTYMEDWKFIVIVDSNSVVTSYLQLLSKISYTLSINDTLKVEYQSKV